MTMPNDPETRKLIQSVARETAKAVSVNVSKKAVHETLVSIGLDPSDPITAQETQSNMRKIAACADDLAAIAQHYKDDDTRDAIQFAKDVHGTYKSTKARAVAGTGAAVITVWMTGLWHKLTSLLG